MVSLSLQSSKRSVVCPPATALTIPYVSSLSQSVCLIWEFPAFLLHFLSPFPFRFGVSFHFIEVTLTFTLIVRFSPPSLSYLTFPPFYPIDQCLVHLFSWIRFSSVPCYHVFLLLHPLSSQPQMVALRFYVSLPIYLIVKASHTHYHVSVAWLHQQCKLNIGLGRSGATVAVVVLNRMFS